MSPKNKKPTVAVTVGLVEFLWCGPQPTVCRVSSRPSKASSRLRLRFIAGLLLAAAMPGVNLLVCYLLALNNVLNHTLDCAAAIALDLQLESGLSRCDCGC